MDKPQNKFLSVHYQLYTVTPEGEKELEEQTSPEHPFEFISGFGIALEGFEKNLVDKEAGSSFDFMLEPEEAFGVYDPEGVHKLSRDVFTIKGKFDSENIYPGAIITLTDVDNNRFMAQVKKVEEDGITIDTNHPHAGKKLNFVGEMKENREATLEEIKVLLARMSGEGCSGCGHHDKDCGEGGCGGCGQHHGNGGCGGCH